ncbi:MAG: DUF177 domain-containing protein [Eggerthellaceae bacterium]|nr:DUF177 domain-containing protein [Eggerthellaceae bacterium]
MEPVRIHIPKELFEPAETESFAGEAPLGTLDLGNDEYSFSEPCKWEVQVTNTGGALLVQGSAKVSGTTSCIRCLEDAKVELDGAIEGYFVITPEGEDPDLEGDEFEELPANHVMDLTPLILQGLLLAAPRQPLCKEDCLGLCPKCGQDLNIGECACSSDDVDPMNPFAVLKDLDL